MQRWRVRTRTVLAVLVGLAMTACGSSAGQIDPSGVDELVVPSPAPDPDDFVPTISNAWLPLAPGATWTYGTEATPEQVVVTVQETTGEVAGIATTRVQVEHRTGTDRVRTVDDVAQDARGNVWWLGREGEWQVDESTPAGLLWPAEPRVGDGWVSARVDEGANPDGVGVDLRTRVLGPVPEHSNTLDSWSDLLLVEQQDALGAGRTRESLMVRGVGAVQLLTASGEVLELTARTP